MRMQEWIRANKAVNLGIFRTYGDKYNIIVCKYGSGFVFGKLYDLGACGVHFEPQGFEVFKSEKEAILGACKYAGIN
jgi:hypothetical protein